VAGWLYQAKDRPPPSRVPSSLEAEDAAEVRKWGGVLQPGRSQARDDGPLPSTSICSSRIIKFGTFTNEFFELVRSRTPPGAPIDLVGNRPSVRRPGVPAVYYRFRKIYSTNVQKTHMVYELDDARMRRFEELFIEPEWLQEPHLAGIRSQDQRQSVQGVRTDPSTFKVHVSFWTAPTTFLMTFIHGPVCKGQIALNVINDHFLVLFLDPDHDLSVRYPGFLKLHADRLSMPIEMGAPRLFSALTDKVTRSYAIEYYKARQDTYAALALRRARLTTPIWRGTGIRCAAATVYRHFDSASVTKGRGESAEDPLGDRYRSWNVSLCARRPGSMVYGTVGTPAGRDGSTWTGPDRGGKLFPRFSPPGDAKRDHASWYLDTDLEKMDYHQGALPSEIRFATPDPKREFVNISLRAGSNKETAITSTESTTSKSGEEYPAIPLTYEAPDDYLERIPGDFPPSTPFVALRQRPQRGPCLYEDNASRWEGCRRHDRCESLA